MIHSEIILKRYGRKSLGGSLHLYALLGLYSLVQTVRITASLKDTSRLLINNLDLAVSHHILDILVKHGICLQQLVHGVHTLALDCEIGKNTVFLDLLLLSCKLQVLLNLGHGSSDIRKHEKIRV